MIATILYTDDKGGKTQNLSLPLLSFNFLTISFVLSATTVILELLKVIDVSWPVIIVLNILLQCYYLVKVIVFSCGASYISKVENKASQQLIKFDQLSVVAKQCLALATEANHQKILKKICDAIQYSDPIGRQEIAEDDKKIRTLLDALKQKLSAKESNVEGLCHDLLQAIQARNENLRILKMKEL